MSIAQTARPTSSCKEIMKTVSAEGLASLIKGSNENNLIIDCRSFLAYNKEHIEQAVNVRCNRIMKRRQHGCFSLENAIMNSEKRKQFLDGDLFSVVVYDENGDINSEDLQEKQKTVVLVYKVIRDHARLDVNVWYLKGAFKNELSL